MNQIKDAPRHRLVAHTEPFSWTRAVLTIITAGLLCWLLSLAVFGSPPAAARDLGYSAKTDDERRALTGLVIRTRVCMYDGTRALTRMGVTNHGKLREGLIQLCGPSLFNFLTDNAGWTDLDAAKFVVAIAEQELQAASSWGR